MKKSRLITAIASGGALASVITPLTVLTSCNKEERHDPVVEDPEIEVNTDWDLNFVYKNDDGLKREGYFAININNFVGGEKVKIELDEVFNEAGDPIMENIPIKITSEDVTVKEGDSYVAFQAGSVNDDILNTPAKYTFNIKVTVTRGSKKYELYIGSFELDVAMATKRSDFTFSGDIITGFNSESQDISKCDLFLLPGAITAISEGAFVNEDGSTKIPVNMKYMVLDATWGAGTPALANIGNNAFKNAQFTGDCYIPASVQTIGQSAFQRTKFTRFYVGLGEGKTDLKTIGQLSFEGCGSLRGDCIIPEGVETIADSAFWTAGFNGNLVIPSTVKTIGQFAFRNWTNNSKGKITFASEDSQLTAIGRGAFYQNRFGIDELYIPDGVTTIKSEAFANCPHMKTISIAPGVTTYNDLVFQKSPYINCVDISRIRNMDDPFLKGTKRFFSTSCTMAETVTIIVHESLKVNEAKIKESLVSNKIPEDKIVFEYVK